MQFKKKKNYINTSLSQSVNIRDNILNGDLQEHKDVYIHLVEDVLQKV